MLIAVDCHIALHGGKDASLEIGRPKLRIGLEMQQDLISLLAYNVPDKRIGKHLQEFGRLVVIVLAALALLCLRPRVIHKGAHLIALLIFSQCLPIPLDHAVETCGSRLCNPLFHGITGLAIDFEIEPMGVVVATGGELGLNGLPDYVAWRLCETRKR
jgi:hypothetical protein